MNTERIVPHDQLSPTSVANILAAENNKVVRYFALHDLFGTEPVFTFDTVKGVSELFALIEAKCLSTTVLENMGAVQLGFHCDDETHELLDSLGHRSESWSLEIGHEDRVGVTYSLSCSNRETLQDLARILSDALPDYRATICRYARVRFVYKAGRFR